MPTRFTRSRKAAGSRSARSSSPRGTATSSGSSDRPRTSIEYGPQLRKNVFQYINTDQLTTGDPFVVSASPGLYAFMKQICDVVPAADGNGMLGARDQRRRSAAQSDHRRLRSPELLLHAGVLSTSNGYYGVFRRAPHRRRQSSTDYARTTRACAEAVATAQVTGIQAMRAANATVEPLADRGDPRADARRSDPRLQTAAFQRATARLPIAELRQALTHIGPPPTEPISRCSKPKRRATSRRCRRSPRANRPHATHSSFRRSAENPYYHTIDRLYHQLSGDRLRRQPTMRRRSRPTSVSWRPSGRRRRRYSSRRRIRGRLPEAEGELCSLRLRRLLPMESMLRPVRRLSVALTLGMLTASWFRVRGRARQPGNTPIASVAPAEVRYAAYGSGRPTPTPTVAVPMALRFILVR